MVDYVHGFYKCAKFQLATFRGSARRIYVKYNVVVLF
jgi:hypothetical protein